MDIKKASRNIPGRTRTVHPLADPELIDPKGKHFDPAFSVTVVDESNTATARRWDRFDWNPNNLKDKHYSEKMMKCSQAEVEELVTDWENLFDGETAIECTDESTIVLIEVAIPTLDADQKWKSLWRLTQIALDKQREADSGN